MTAEVLPIRASDAGPVTVSLSDFDWRDFLCEAEELLEHARDCDKDDIKAQRQARILFMSLAKEAIEKAEELLP